MVSHMSFMWVRNGIFVALTVAAVALQKLVSGLAQACLGVRAPGDGVFPFASQSEDPADDTTVSA